MADENTIPAWKIKADKLNKMIKDDPTLGKQVVYRSKTGINDDACVAPEISDHVMTDNEYPDVAEEPPVTMLNPKYSWATPAGWYDNSVTQQGQQIIAIDKSVSDISAKVASLQKAHEDVEKDVSNSTQQFTQLKQMLISQTMMLNKIVSAVKPTESTATPTPTTPQAASTPVQSKDNQ